MAHKRSIRLQCMMSFPTVSLLLFQPSFLFKPICSLPVELGMDRYNHRNATKNERSTGGRSGTAQPFPLWRLPQRPVCDAHQSKIFGSGISIMSPRPEYSDA